MVEIYLDNAASTPPDPRVLAEYDHISKYVWGNPSNTLHEAGKLAKNILEQARWRVGRALGLDPRGIVFTSGATEANNLALKGAQCLHNRKCALVVSAIEHACVKETAQLLANKGIIVREVKVNPNGQINLESLERAISDSPTASLVSIMAANNETGVIQPIAQAAQIAHKNGALFHTDATQAIGKMPLGEIRGADMISLSGHKIHGMKGIGALWVRPGINMSPILQGGGQEHGLRSGTTPVPLATSLAAALELAEHDKGWLEGIRPHIRNFEREVAAQAPGARITGNGSRRVANISHISFPFNTPVASLLHKVAASTGSACGCDKKQPSYVMVAMGAPAKRAANCVRISAGRFTQPEDLRLAAQEIIEAAKTIKQQKS